MWKLTRIFVHLGKLDMRLFQRLMNKERPFKPLKDVPHGEKEGDWNEKSMQLKIVLQNSLQSERQGHQIWSQMQSASCGKSPETRVLQLHSSY